MCLARGRACSPGGVGVPRDHATLAALIAERRLARRQAHALEILTSRVRRGPAKKQLRLVRERIRRFNGQMSTWCQTLADWMRTCSVALEALEVLVRRQDAWIRQKIQRGSVPVQVPPSLLCHASCPWGRELAQGVPSVLRSCRCGRWRPHASSPLPSPHNMLHCLSYLSCMMERMARAWCLAPARLHRVTRPPSSYWRRLAPDVAKAVADAMATQLVTVEGGASL